MTRNEVMTSLESPMSEVAVKEIIKEGIAGLELVVSLHINSLNGGSDETTDAQYSPALTKSLSTTTMIQSTLSPVSGNRQPGY